MKNSWMDAKKNFPKGAQVYSHVLVLLRVIMIYRVCVLLFLCDGCAIFLLVSNPRCGDDRWSDSQTPGTCHGGRWWKGVKNNSAGTPGENVFKADPGAGFTGCRLTSLTKWSSICQYFS